MTTEQQETLVDEAATTASDFIPETDADHVQAACKVLSKKLESEAENLAKLNSEKAERAVRADIGELDEAIPRVLNDQGIAGLNGKQRALARTAVPIYATRLKAARGTMQGIFRADLAAQCETAAAYVEGTILPQLEEQTQAAAAE